MNWTEAEIFTSTEGIEILSAVLPDMGIKGFSIKDSADFNEFLENKNGKWDYIDDDLMGLKSCESSVTVYLPDNIQGAETLAALKNMLGGLKENDTENRLGRLELELKTVKEEDWANNWKKYFKPFTIGDKLLIKPSWEECENAGKRTILEIDPASSFGTGQHNTTKLCLELLEKTVKQGDRILDLGCGSGILSIGGILLGAKEAAAVDIEQNAVETAEENAVKNNISTKCYHTYQGDIISDEGLREKIGGNYDIITANIVADVLIAMSGIFKQFLKPDSKLIISGIITQRKSEVINAVKNAGFAVTEEAESDGWAAVMLSCCEVIPVVTDENIIELEKLAIEIWNQHFVSIIGQGQVDYMLDKFQSFQAMKKQISDGMNYIMLKVDGENSGYYGFKKDGDRVFLSKLYVKLDKRGKGLSRIMLEEVKRFAAENDLKAIYLTVNKHNDDTIAIYKHMGFSIVDSVVSDIGGGFVMDDYIMQCGA